MSEAATTVPHLAFSLPSWWRFACRTCWRLLPNPNPTPTPTHPLRSYAGGLGFIIVDNIYYIVGEGAKVYQDLSEGFAMYKSKDLGTWERVGGPGAYVLHNTSLTACWEANTGAYRMERPKVSWWWSCGAGCWPLGLCCFNGRLSPAAAPLLRKTDRVPAQQPHGLPVVRACAP